MSEAISAESAGGGMSSAAGKLALALALAAASPVGDATVDPGNERE